MGVGRRGGGGAEARYDNGSEGFVQGLGSGGGKEGRQGDLLYKGELGIVGPR